MTATTPNQGYPLPAASTKLKLDVLRLIAALTAIDSDVFGLQQAMDGKSDTDHGHAMADIAGLVSALSNKLDVGYHDALANLTDVDVAGVANGMALLRQASKWIPVALQINNIAGLETALNAKATPADITAAINALVASAPGLLDTLDELAAALGDDPAFATTVMTALANRVRVDAVQAFTNAQQGQARANIGAIGNIHKRTVITASGTHTYDTATKYAVVEVQGGGGGGGASNSGPGEASGVPGGGAGGYASKLVVSPPATASISIGAGGSVGSAGGNSQYSDGTSLITGGGGSGGTTVGGSTVTIGFGSAAGGAASGGDLNIPGGPGERGFSIGTVASGSDIGFGSGGDGGCAQLGPGGRGATNYASSAYGLSGAPPLGGYGGGGGGGMSAIGGTSSGGAGAPGVIIITEYK